ncbi:MAG: NYN domain-containing protein [Candidatus Babeliales bacterium]
MILIIDAYNVLKQALHTDHISEIERLRFIKQVGLYGKTKGHTMIVVFDGGPHQRPNQDRVHGVSVVYSGTQETADEYIHNYLQRHRTLDLMVVSSDRQICAWAAERNIPSLEAVDFYRLVHMKHQKESLLNAVARQIVKTTQTTVAELDALMEETAIEHKEEGDHNKHTRTSRGYHPTKQERHIIKKIKKL